MSRTDFREVKSIVNVSFYPDHYLNHALAADAKKEGVSHDSLKKARMAFTTLMGKLGDAGNDPASAAALRQELIDLWYKTLGHLDHSEKFALGQTCLLRLGTKTAEIAITRKAPLYGDGELWLIDDLKEVVSDGDEVEDSRGTEHFYQNSFSLEVDGQPKAYTWQKIIDAVFDSDFSAAEWLIINQGDQLILVERGRWQEHQQSYIAVDAAELFALHDDETYRMVQGLFGPGAFPIESANYFHDTLEQESHKKATEVTKSLRGTVKDSIELVANGILDYHYTVGIPQLDEYDLLTDPDKSAAAKLVFEQALRYTYRMLFMFYAESHTGAKEGLPVNSKAYQMGYSIEKLRDLENKPLIEGQNNFIQQTLDQACRIYYEGYNTDLITEFDEHTGEEQIKTDAFGFAFPRLGTQLFDPAQTDLVAATKLPDVLMQKVIKALSLAKTGKGRTARTHRVHYAGLGLNQLGAVYEGLLALKPEIIPTDSYLLEKVKNNIAHGFVPVDQKVDKKQLAQDDDGKPITMEAGTFLLTPVGLDRKFSASFYTPEVLTRCLAKQSVDLLLEDKKTIEELEDLKILEPAMGSGAFLIAVVDELAVHIAKLYQKRDAGATKQASGAEYQARAKDHLMRHCIYGVDLNPIAVELAKISLWLNCVDRNGNLPFLDYKLRSGNSLVGCWLTRFRKKDLPHFVLPHPEALDTMLNGKVLGEKDWPFIAEDEDRAFVKDLKKQWTKAWEDKKTLERARKVADKIDALYKQHVVNRQQVQDAIKAEESTMAKATVFAELQKTDFAYNQLRAMADYWCSLWYWPVEELGCLPSPDEYLTVMEFFAGIELAYAGDERMAQLDSAGIPSLLVARDVSLEQNFFHWDLEYPLVFERGGFDLVLGNPPWAPVRWEEKDFFEEQSPGLHAVKMGANKNNQRYQNILNKSDLALSSYVTKKVIAEGFANFLKQSETFRFTDSSKSNTYRYFFQRFRELASDWGRFSYIGQDGVFSDKGCIEVRKVAYRELTNFHRFHNELCLFEDVHHCVSFLLSYYRKAKKRIDFQLIDNLFLPDTIDKCRRESALTNYRGIKNENGGWEIRGHPNRIITMTDETLSRISLFQGDIASGETKLPVIHGKVELDILVRLADHPFKMAGRYFFSSMFNERNAPVAGCILREPAAQENSSKAVMTGPNLFVGNPAYKRPNVPCKNNLDFEVCELESVSDGFFPATVYQITERGLISNDYLTETPWGTKHKDQFRIFSRAMVSTTGARTLSSAIVPPGPSHIHGINSLSFRNAQGLVSTSALLNSLFFDFLMRSLCGGHIVKNTYDMTPTLTETQIAHPLTPGLMIRALRLSAISTHYAPLWEETFRSEFKELEFTSEFAPSLPYSKLKDKWERHSALRCPKQREQALCETDAIVAILFGFGKDTLLNLYRAQFGVLQKNLQDLPDKAIDPDKYHFPRWQAMADAYDQALAFTESKTNTKQRA